VNGAHTEPRELVRSRRRRHLRNETYYLEVSQEKLLSLCTHAAWWTCSTWYILTRVNRLLLRVLLFRKPG